MAENTGSPRPERLREDKKRIEMRHLRYFVALAEERNFGRAARRLNMAQPPLSQQIKQLETWVQARLCDRTPRGIKLTPAGTAFLAHARKVLRQMEFTVQMTREVESGLRGELRLTAIYSALYSITPTVVRALKSQLPNVVIHLREMTVMDQVVALQNGDVDVGFVRLPIRNSPIATLPLIHEKLIVAVPYDHPLAQEKAVSLQTLCDESLLVSAIGTEKNFQNSVLRLFTDRGLSPYLGRETPDMHSLIGLVGAGLGVGIVPQAVRQVNLPNVVYIDIIDDLPGSTLALAWDPAYRSPLIERALAIVSETFGATFDIESWGLGDADDGET